MKSKLKVQFTILVILFVVAELVLRCFGMRAGTLIDEFKMQDSPVYQPRFYSDSEGINHLLPTLLINGSILNRQGFRGNIDYTPEVIDSIRKNTKKQIIMMIGDSYVEGCCPENVYNSFPDILDRDPRYQVLNFGVAGTDPLQYELVAKKYAGLLKPDRVVVVVYLGNDITSFKRKPSPGVPLTFTFRNNKWLFEIAPGQFTDEINYNFGSADEAYTFYMDHYTLRGKHRNLAERLLSYSVIGSKMYLAAENVLAQRNWQKKHPGVLVDGNQIVHDNLMSIQHTCDSAGLSCIFMAIPSPQEAKNQEDLRKKYKEVFSGITWHVPENLTAADYDGPGIGNHFNIQGHKKYSVFLMGVLAGK